MTIRVKNLDIPDVKLITSARHGDERGYFAETWNERDLIAAGLRCDFVQDNQAMSISTGTIRGLHFQTAPFAQGKLLRVLKGRIFDVAVDIRTGSETYGQWVGVELDSTGGQQIWIPQGFAHGYCTLESDTEVLYKADAYYNPGAEAGLRWDDPDIGIDWPRLESVPTISSKDQTLPAFATLQPVNITKVDRRRSDSYHLSSPAN